eukprot:10291168-Alexandrium_andersonii.AAC.1
MLWRCGAEQEVALPARQQPEHGEQHVYNAGTGIFRTARKRSLHVRAPLSNFGDFCAPSDTSGLRPEVLESIQKRPKV